MNRLFNDNVGKRVKTIAIAGFIIESIAAIIGGFIAFADGQIGTGFAVILGGISGAYLVSVFVYSFGVLVDKTVQIASNTGRIKSLVSQSVPAQPNNAQKNNAQIKEYLKNLYEKGLMNSDDYNRFLATIDAEK